MQVVHIYGIYLEDAHKLRTIADIIKFLCAFKDCKNCK